CGKDGAKLAESEARASARAMFATWALPHGRASDTFWLFGIGDREISFFAPHEEPRQAARRMDRHFDLVPLAVAVEVRGLVANRILVPKFQRNLFKDVIHLSAAPGIKSFPARDTGEFIEDALAFHAQRAA